MRNETQLITYVDRLGGDLAGLRALLQGPLAGVFGGVHLLPFFHPIDGADAGFDPIDHTTVDRRLGGWDGVAALGSDFDVMADMIVNHVSASSPPFLDWVEKGPRSEFDGMYLTYDSVFPQGASEADLTGIYRPRPGLPFTVVDVAGKPRLIWTTFTSNQIDIDVTHPAAWAYLTRILDRFVEGKVNLVRLDAVGYAIKKPGTSSFMIPETFEFIERLGTECEARGMTMLVEIHSYYQTQIEIASKVDLVYDFALPPLVLDAVLTGDSLALRRWIEIRPTNCVTVLDTHDGIGVIDVGADSETGAPGLLEPARLDALVERIHAESGGSSRLATGAAASNLDLYQINCTILDALGGDHRRHRIARLLQVLVPGVPQIYYVGALGGRNDVELLQRTNVGRDINRHFFTPDEIDAALADADVNELLNLYRWRNTDPVFGGSFFLHPGDGSTLRMSWSHLDRTVDIEIDLADLAIATTITDGSQTTTFAGLDFCR